MSDMNFGVAILATLFAYDGWILLAALGGEMKNPESRPESDDGRTAGRHRHLSFH